MDPISPCPACGPDGKPELHNLYLIGPNWVQCRCGLRTIPVDGQEKAIEWWNRLVGRIVARLSSRSG